MYQDGKRECVGHVQKHLGTRLRNLKKKKKKKGLGGKGKLTNSTNDRLQIYYGIAIRSNKNDLHGIKTSIYASLFHVASSMKHSYHGHYPKFAESWYQKDKATCASTYKPRPGLPLNVIAELKSESISWINGINSCLSNFYELLPSFVFFKAISRKLLVHAKYPQIY